MDYIIGEHSVEGVPTQIQYRLGTAQGKQGI